MKKAISLFLALLLCLNYLPTFDLFEAAAAENVWHGDSYKVDVKAGSNGYTYQSSYKTPCHAYEFSNHMVTNGTRRTDYPQYYASDIPQLLILLNAESDYTWTPNGVYEFGKSNYEVLYCCDAVTGYVHGVHYKRMNLEDSSYYDPDAAKHIRAIVTNSYPYISVEQMKADLKAEGFKDADKLTRADLITAIQTAIWSYANSEENPPSFYSQTFDVTANTQWGRVMHDYSNEMRDADGKAWWYDCKVNLKTGAGILIDDEIGARIGALIEHLKKREPVDPVEKQVIISKLNIVDFAPVMEVDGLYRVMLRANLNNSGSSANDDISLDIYVDDVFFGTKKVMMGTESYDFSVLAKPEQTIKIVVSGTQILPTGVYFYEAEGGREVSQSLVGIAGGATEVYSEDSVVIPEIEGVTADLKLSKVDNNNKPLTGAEFTLYAKGEKGTVKVGTYAVDEAGELLIEDLLPGEYLLEETKIPFGYLAPEQSIKFEVTKTGYILLTQGDHAEIVDGDSYNVTVKKDGDVMIDEYVPELEIDIIPGKTTNGQVSEKIGSDSDFVLIVRSGEVISGDVTVTVNKSFSGTINSILPALKFDRNDPADQALQKKIRELYTDEHFADPSTIIVPPAPVGYPFLYAGHAGDYSAHYVSKVKVYFKRDLNGDPIKDENGNYVIDRLTKSNGTPLTYKGVATTNINGPFDQKTGTRARQFLLKDALGNVLYAYCIDVETDAVNNSWYRLANLEDNDYYATEDAENRVRAILEKGYWGTAEGVGSLESLKDALKKFVRSGAVETEYDISFVIRGAKYTSNSVLADGEYVGDGVICHTVTEHVTLTEELIDGLTEGEALDAMTMAIWTYANGSQSTLDGKDGAVMGDLGYGSCASGDSINGQNDFAGAARTKALYAYLIGLEGKQKSTVIINDKTFAENMKLIVGKKIADGIYEGKLRFTLGTELGEKDNLTVALTYVDAYGKTQTLEVPLTGVGALVAENGFYTIGGLTLKAGEAFDFSLNVYGDQYLERGAYILTAQNGSQTMVTIAEGMNAVDVTKTASVSFIVEESRHYEKTYTKTEQTLVVVNYPETVSISGSKTWDDNNDQDGVRPEKITIYLLADGETVATKVVTADDNWKWSFVGMNKYNGTEEIIYTVLEEVVDGYKTSYDGFNVTNTHIPEKIEIEGTKIWNDNNDQDGIRPDSIEIILFANGEEIDRKTVTKDDWTFKFTDLPKYENGVEIKYTVKEVAVEGYETTYEGFDIINTHVPEEIEIEGTKTWIDNNDQDGIRPDSIVIILFANNEEIDRKTVTSDNNWAFSFTELPKYENGEEIVYSVKEVAVEGYETTYETSDNIINIINTHVPEEIEIEGTKTWIDNNNQDGIRPDSIEIILFANGEEIDRKTVTKDDWTFKFTNLPKYENGEEIKYEIFEAPVAGYETTYDGFNVINTHVPDVTSVSGSKIWKDNDNQDGIRPESVEIILFANGEEIDRKTVTSDNNWAFSFTNLPKYKDGVEIKYTVKEVAVEGYETTYEGFNIINTHVPEEIEIEGTKTWNDNNNQDGIRPDSIVVNLLANGEKVAEKIVTAANNWSFTFTDLPKYKNGEEIKYEISEAPVVGYETSYDGFNVINTHVPEKIQVSVLKIWDDQDDIALLRPVSIIVNFFADGVKIDSCVLSEATGWTYTLANLDKYANGAEIAYTITEEPVEHYDSVITGNAKDGYVVTNTYIFEIPEEPVPETSDRTLYGAIATAVATIALGVAVLLKRRSLLEDAE